jgi:hypothetical protein
MAHTDAVSMAGAARKLQRLQHAKGEPDHPGGAASPEAVLQQ